MLEYFESFKRSAFRLEVLQEYDVSYEKKAFEEFIKPGVVDQEINSQLEQEDPENYAGSFIVPRDLALLKKAQEITRTD